MDAFSSSSRSFCESLSPGAQRQTPHKGLSSVTAIVQQHEALQRQRAVAAHFVQSPGAVVSTLPDETPSSRGRETANRCPDCWGGKKKKFGALTRKSGGNQPLTCLSRGQWTKRSPARSCNVTYSRQQERIAQSGCAHGGSTGESVCVIPMAYHNHFLWSICRLWNYSFAAQLGLLSSKQTKAPAAHRNTLSQTWGRGGMISAAWKLGVKVSAS